MDITIKIAVLAMIFQVFLTLYIIVKMGKSRTASLVAGELHIRDIALSNDAWSDDIKKLGNNLRNQFETPVMFYAAVILMAALSLNSWIIAGLAVIYAMLRVVHHLIHTGKNHVPTRFKVYVLSLGVLALMWVTIAVEVVIR